MSVTVRKATRKDAAAIAALALKLFEQHREYDSERFADLGNFGGAEAFYGSRTEAAHAAVLLAEIGGEPVGFAYLEYEAVNYSDLLESVAWLHDIYLEESARGLGAGKMLIDATAEAARELGATKIVLHVAARNPDGQAFFERSGFRTTMHEMMLNIGA